MAELLRVENIESSYGASQVLFGISIEVGVGEVVTLLGRNGMGKTTTIRSIMGLLKPHAGEIYFKEQLITGEPSFKVAQAGIGLVPEGRQIFPNLNVHENLVATASNRSNITNPWTVEKIYTLFPALADRQSNAGNQLSGGEQQMLAISRALMTNPDLLILDEATEGLAPLVRDDIWNVLEQLKSDGQSILVIDKNVDVLCRIADQHYIIEKGVVVWSGGSDNLQKDFDEENKFQTNIRGLKVRGVYETKDSAERRAKKLQTLDSDFHVFVGQVGYWLPWDPTADKIEDEHFTDSQLNELMQKYKENNVNKDIFYEDQKRDKIKAAQEERLQKEKEDKENKEKEDKDSKVDGEPASDKIEGEPEPEKVADEPQPCCEPETEDPKVMVDEPCSIISEEPVEQSDLERALTSEDPWMQQKNNVSN